MKDLFGFLICIALGILLQSYFPWWIVVFAGVPSALFFYSGASKSFWLSFAATVIPWILFPLFIDFANAHILSVRMQAIFMRIPVFAIQSFLAILVGILTGSGAYISFSFRNK